MTRHTIRVALPFHLQTLSRTTGEVKLDVANPVTPHTVVDALERQYPMLCGTVRDHVTKQRRAFLRYFVCQRDISHDDVHAKLPPEILSGEEPFIIWGALSGG